jgi:hypothetical protein
MSDVVISFATTTGSGFSVAKMNISKTTGEVSIQNLTGIGDRSICAHADGTLFAC